MHKVTRGAFALWSGASRFHTADIVLVQCTQHVKSEALDMKSDMDCDIVAFAAVKSLIFSGN
jgi:hypothetical protein